MLRGKGTSVKNGKKPIANPFVALQEEFDDWAVLFNRIPSTISGATFSLVFSLLLSSCLLLTLPLVLPGETYGGQATLAWDPDSASGLAGYKVHYGTVSKNYSFTIDAGVQTTATVTGLTEGATYYFAATAYNTGGTESTPSNEVTYTVPASCSFTIAPNSKSSAASAGTGSVAVTTAGTCSWTTSNTTSWITITSGASGTGNGTVNYSVAANTGTSPRIAGLTIAGTVFTLTQAGVPTYTITASTGTNGTISPSGSVSVTGGANQTFTVSPASGYQVAALTVDGASVGAVTSYTFTNVTANHMISASFAATNYTLSARASFAQSQIRYALTVTKTGSGSGTVTSYPSWSTLTQGRTVTLIARADKRSTFVGWSGACSGTSSTCTVLMTGNMTVTATFNSTKRYSYAGH
jgi:uncharacterized repeat protein (TIGR02543 family)